MRRLVLPWVLLVVGWPQLASAWRQAHNPVSMPLHWPSPMLRVFVAPDDKVLVAAVDHALREWSRPGCTALKMQRVERREGADVEIRVDAKWSMAAALAAHTETTSDDATGALRHADIRINPSMRLTDAAAPKSDEVDALGLMVHELGHALGLAHTPVRGAVMRQGLRAGMAAKRTLHADDVRAVCTLYPSRPPALE